jgi:peptidoglycan hydrolase CwlO-like protein
MSDDISHSFKKGHHFLFLILMLGSIFFGGIFFAQANSDISCAQDSLDGKTDKELQLALEKCEKEIAEQKALLDDKQKDSVTIEFDIAKLDYKINQAKAEIRRRDIKIRQLGKSVVVKEKEIVSLSQKTDNMQASLAELIRKTDELNSYSLVETMLSNESLSDFFVDVDNFDVLKKNLRVSLTEIKDLKSKTENAKEDLKEKERNERGLKITKEAEKRKTASYKSEKKRLLSLNREEEEKYKQTIAEKEKIKNDIRTRMFRTVGGTEISFGDALALVSPYEEKIGVESALVLAVLFQESGANNKIGGNLGRCTYNQPAPNKSGTVMSDSQKPSFLAIMKELGMNPNTKPVSCPIPRDGQYGGAMGPAQFMPKTWWDIDTGYGYKKRIAKVLGIPTPSPFINLDAFTGTALYLSDARDRCAGPNGFDSTFKILGCTAAKYYSGLGSSGSRLARHMNPTYSYGYKVAKRAQEFQKDIDLLNQ